jgi:tetratricopeptide (TPR) repeat protein
MQAVRLLVGVCLLLSPLFAQDPVTPAPDPLPPLLEAGQASYVKGDYEPARQALLQAWEIAQQRAPEDPARYDVLKRLTSVRAAAGEFADADAFLQLAINWRETVVGPFDPRIADDLLISVNLCRGMKDYTRALAILGRVMSMHGRAAGALESLPLADDYSRMAQIHMELKNLNAAVGMLEIAIRIRGSLAGPLDPSIVPDLDRMAGALITLRSYDKAEATYRRALVIRETLLGKFDADLIATVDGLAYSMFGQKKFDEAEPVYRRLVDLWVRSLGEDHPMVSLACDKMSIFYEQQKKWEQAREAKERSVAIRTHFLGTGLSSAATSRMAEEKRDEALVFYKRALLVLDPPHPLYDEMRGEIADLVKGLEPPPPAQPTPPQPVRKKK